MDISVLWTAFAAVGPAPPVAPLVVAYLVGYLANATPIPGGVGVLDAGLVGALALYGLPITHAAAAVLVYHAIAFWLPTLGGTIAYASLRPRLVPDVDGRDLADPRREPARTNANPAIAPRLEHGTGRGQFTSAPLTIASTASSTSDTRAQTRT